MLTSWTCDDSTNDGGDCMLIYELIWYRHVKDVKIGKLCRLHMIVAVNLYKKKWRESQTGENALILSFQFSRF